MIQLQRDSRKAFEKLYAHYFNPVYRNAYKLLRDADGAADIVQETFLRLWENRSKINATVPLGGWLFVVSYNKAVNELKKKLRQSKLNNVTASEIFFERSDAGYQTQSELLEEAIAHLSPQKKNVFVLCKIYGNTYDEAAEKLNISKYTVKEYLSAAVSTVKRYVDQHATTAYCAILLSQLI
nr:RNA polymerase sigma factor [Niabella ginsengisoli]